MNSAIEDVKNLIETGSYKQLKYLKSKKELHNSAREMQKHIENTSGVGASTEDMKLRERIKRYLFYSLIFILIIII